jgi:hypothetical protein
VDSSCSGECRCRLPASPLNRISKELNRYFDVSWCLKGNLKESVVDEVSEVIPISTSVAEARGWVVMNCRRSEGYQDRGMVGGQV